MSDAEHDPRQVRMPSEGEVNARLGKVRDAAQVLADAVNHVPKLPPLPIPHFTYPTLQAPLIESANERHRVVAVRTIPVSGKPSQTHTYQDDAGLEWQTHGEEHNFSTDRLLEIQTADGQTVASYPAGTWLHVCYVSYLQPEPLKMEGGGGS